MKTPPIYAIHLSTCEERASSLLGQAGKLGLEVNLFAGLDGRKSGVRASQRMTAGDVGCCLSHWFLWNRLVEEDNEWVVVLEDDVDLQEDFVEVLGHAIDEARELELQVVYLGWFNCESWPKKFRLKTRPVSSSLSSGSGVPGGTHAMLLHRSALPILIATNEVISDSIDLQIGKNSLDKLRWAVCTEKICRQGRFPSLSRRNTRTDETGN